jgi:hypothetical protein
MLRSSTKVADVELGDSTSLGRWMKRTLNGRCESREGHAARARAASGSGAGESEDRPVSMGAQHTEQVSYAYRVCSTSGRRV